MAGNDGAQRRIVDDEEGNDDGCGSPLFSLAVLARVHSTEKASHQKCAGLKQFGHLNRQDLAPMSTAVRESRTRRSSDSAGMQRLSNANWHAASGRRWEGGTYCNPKAAGVRGTGRRNWNTSRGRSTGSTWTTTPGRTFRRMSMGGCGPWCAAAAAATCDYIRYGLRLTLSYGGLPSCRPLETARKMANWWARREKRRSAEREGTSLTAPHRTADPRRGRPARGLNSLARFQMRRDILFCCYAQHGASHRRGWCRPQDPRAAQRAKRRRLLSEAVSARIRRGLIRYLEVVVDLSRASALGDFRPTRASVVAGAATPGRRMTSCITLWE